MRGDSEIRDPNARLDALWEATRPAEPSAQAWDRVWESVAGELDRISSTTTSGRSDVIRREGVFFHQASQVSSRRPLAVAAAAATVMLAQAAAILLAVGLSWRGADPEAGAPTGWQVATADVRVEEGQFVLIRSNADAVQTIDLSARLGAGDVDAWYEMYNRLEWTSQPVVAMSE